MKKCTKCLELKPLDKFYKRKASIDGLQPLCKICVKEYKKQHYLLNKEKIDIKTKQYHKDNPQANKKATENYRRNHPEKNKRIKRAYQKNNKGKVNAITRKRQAAKLNRTPLWLTKEQIKEMEQFYINAQNLTQETGIKYAVDHIIPLQGKNISGLHVPWNLRVITAFENTSKGNRYD